MKSEEQHISGINPLFSTKEKKIKDIKYYLNGLAEGNRYVLSECITLLESTLEKKRSLGFEILQQLPKSSQPTYRIGITGSPGVGKSTFIESLGTYIIHQGHKPAILAIDPSSQINKGSILGDKTRMATLASNTDAFIRPSPTGSVLGGTGQYTKEAILLCEASGFDFVIVETVGVGQSEVEVDYITDINLLLLLPGAGDEIQGIKRGIVESADIFIITKSDGSQEILAEQSKHHYESALHLFRHEMEDWQCPVLLTSAVQNKGFDAVYQAIVEYYQLLMDSDKLWPKRQNQELRWFEMQTLGILKKQFFQDPKIRQVFEKLSDQILNQSVSPPVALHQMALEIHQIFNAK